jgi:hypothetical protein
MGRPEKFIDWDRVDQLLMAGCTGIEIAPHFDMHYETFYDRVKEKYKVGFTEYCSLKRQQGESLLREKQYLKALGYTDTGDNTLLIWLGKTRLKQREEDSKIPQSITVRVTHDGLGSGLNISAETVSDSIDKSSE